MLNACPASRRNSATKNLVSSSKTCLKRKATGTELVIKLKILKMETQKPANPMYRPMNSGYGASWQASNGVDPSKIQAVPAYRDVVSFLGQTAPLCHFGF